MLPRVLYMYLRKILNKDAELMIEWMHDKEVIEYLRDSFLSKTMGDVLAFIKEAQSSNSNLHLAICSDSDEYKGTVSLKHIDYEDKNAEFAMVIRKKAMGKGYSQFGMKEIIDKAFGPLGLECIYWCVSKRNNRAIRFYNKLGFNEAYNVPQKALNRYHCTEDLKWYSVLKGKSPVKI